ncbi:hypothetical protein ABZ593_20880 [Streptomyces sp. NPDC012617]
MGNRKKPKHARGNNAWWDAAKRACKATCTERVVQVGLIILEAVVQ